MIRQPCAGSMTDKKVQYFWNVMMNANEGTFGKRRVYFTKSYQEPLGFHLDVRMNDGLF